MLLRFVLAIGATTTVLLSMANLMEPTSAELQQVVAPAGDRDVEPAATLTEPAPLAVTAQESKPLAEVVSENITTAEFTNEAPERTEELLDVGTVTIRQVADIEEIAPASEATASDTKKLDKMNFDDNLSIWSDEDANAYLDAALLNEEEEEPAVVTAPKSEKAALVAVARPSEPTAEPPLPDHLSSLQNKIDKALDIYRHKMLNTRDHSAWSVMHSLIGFGIEKEIRIGGPNGKRVNALGWIAWNGNLGGEKLFHLSSGKIHARRGPGLQGHAGQYLSMLAQSRVRSDYPMKISGRDYTVADLIQREQETCVPGSELTFKLIGLSHYLPIDAEWEDEQGRKWDIARLVQEELKQPIIGAACGGTHRLSGFAYALNKRIKRGGTVDGQFLRAQIFLKEYHEYTFRLQNRDGSFSTEFFAGRGSSRSRDLRLETTGHIAEWLSMSLPEEQLYDERMVKAINHLADLLIEGEDREWKVGPLGHGLHALNLYRARALDPESLRRTSVAGKPDSETTR